MRAQTNRRVTSILGAVAFWVVAGCSGFTDEGLTTASSDQAPRVAGVTTHNLPSESLAEPARSTVSIAESTTVLTEPDRESCATYSYSGVVFETGSATLSSSARTLIQDRLSRVDFATLGAATVTGHSDGRGEVGENRRLSQQRAESVAAVLVDAGVSAESISVVGAGESDPIDPSDSEDAHRANRRFEIEFECA